MYALKTTPEDFVVDEVLDQALLARKGFSREAQRGARYRYYLMRKRSCTTEQAVELVCAKLGLPRKAAGYAGLKDRDAVTSQLISIDSAAARRLPVSLDLGLRERKVRIEQAGTADERLTLGDLAGNRFTIRIVSMDADERERLASLKRSERRGELTVLFPNRYGPQRFSRANVEVGRLLLSGDFRGACGLLIRHDRENGPAIAAHLAASPNGHIAALRLLPKRILSLYPHAVQSMLFNRTLDILWGAPGGDTAVLKGRRLPLIGFGTDLDGLEKDGTIDATVKEACAKAMWEEGLTRESFILRPLPQLSVEGGMRDALAKADVASADAASGTVRFTLGKGQYATVFVQAVMEGKIFIGAEPGDTA
ncbi:tRNA pseudouridine(13) synthase TruD [Candidatus Woesearchaeota archaeon]|nr:tRNA pseudouridine(13) synthase TruD [Candidatus Woesearchaeota archaeon]